MLAAKGGNGDIYDQWRRIKRLFEVEDGTFKDAE